MNHKYMIFGRVWSRLCAHSCRVVGGMALLACSAVVSTPAQELHKPSLPSGVVVAFSVRDAATGEELMDCSAHQVMTPASTLKVVTTATALAMRGRDHRYETQLVTAAVPQDGILDGDVYLVGSGDPTIGSRYYFSQERFGVFDAMARALSTKGIRHIRGRVMGYSPESDFQDLNPHWLIYDAGNYYAAGHCALNACDNVYTISLTDYGRDMSVSPSVPGLKLTQRYGIDSSRSRDSLYVSPLPLPDGSYAITGVYPGRAAKIFLRGAVPSPPLYTAGLLHAAIERAGITVDGEPTVATLLPDSAMQSVVYRHRSSALAAIVERTNTYSLNLYAEALLKLVEDDVPIAPGHNATQASIAALRRYWSERGLPMSELIMYDGSGLSPENKVSPAFLTALLCSVYRDRGNMGDFGALLPTVGKEGTVATFLKKTALDGRAHLKSGTLNSVVSYTGYVHVHGRVYAVAIMANHFPGRAAQVRSQLEQILLQTFGLE